MNRVIRSGKESNVGPKDLGRRPGKLLTQEEAIRELRLDSLGLKDPVGALTTLRRTGKLGYVTINRRVLIPESEIVGFLEKSFRKVGDL